MNNSYVMSASLETKFKSQAHMITAGFAGLMILLMFMLKWKLPVFEKLVEEPGIEVELNLPEEPEIMAGGGGGGGNPVMAAGPAGAAPQTPPAPGVDEESKDIETDDNDKEAPPVVRPVTPKPVEKVVENTSTAKTPPKPIENPAPRQPKAVIGKTLAGTNTGGGVSTTYDRTGGRGNGIGVGDGDGRDGGKGTGDRGGNGPGSGTGTGPRRISGSRVVINPKSMDAGENLRGKVLAEIRVSPDGVGTFVRANRGSVYTSGQAIEIIREWLRRNKFNKSNEESTVVYEFNFLLGG
jgi:hypothetical protein